VADLPERLYGLVARLFPIRRSLTGDGVRETLRIVGEHVPLTVHEVPTGTRVLDWTVPKEWNLRAARLVGPDGQCIADARDNNLCVLGYSIPVRARMPLEELVPHLHSLPEQPDVIPYRTSYYEERWGFCLPDRVVRSLPPGEYEVLIDASLAEGHLTYGEAVLAGDTDEEVLISTHVCHPSLANDNCSGIAVATLLAETLAGRARRRTYRFLFVPGTIGAICWLSRNEARLDRIRNGLVLSNMGDGGRFSYKRSRRGDAEVDRAAAVVLRDLGDADRVRDFEPFGYDERQYCSPGFDLPVGALSRSRWGEYPEYHTSADDLSFVRGEWLAESFEVCLAILGVLERNRTCRNLSPKGEPQLGRRGLYSSLGGATHARRWEQALLWVLNQSDGTRSLLDVAERSGLPFDELDAAACALEDAGLIEVLEQ
jgi:aminopeptidase-like protein